MIIILTQLMHSAEAYQKIINTPNLTWKAKFDPTLTRSDFLSRISPIFKQPKFNYPNFVSKNITIENTLSWPEKLPECVGPDTVRDQKQCASCWAFSASHQLADNKCIKDENHARTPLSEQYFLNCDLNEQGCTGGYLPLAQLFLNTTGLVPESCVKYIGYAESCPLKCDDESELPEKTTSKSFKFVCQTEQTIMEALQSGTVTTAFTTYDDFSYYESGVYQHVYGYSAGGHAVNFVGYGEENHVKYWIVKNSWGTTWGENGYFRIVRGTNDCGIEEQCYQMLLE